jgi:hypothetical protein
VAQAERAHRRLAHEREGVRQDVLELLLARLDLLLPLGGLLLELLGRQLLAQASSSLIALICGSSALTTRSFREPNIPLRKSPASSPNC